MGTFNFYFQCFIFFYSQCPKEWIPFVMNKPSGSFYVKVSKKDYIKE